MPRRAYWLQGKRVVIPSGGTALESLTMLTWLRARELGV